MTDRAEELARLKELAIRNILDDRPTIYGWSFVEKTPGHAEPEKAPGSLIVNCRVLGRSAARVEELAAKVLDTLSWEAVTPEPESWGGRRAEARDALSELVALAERATRLEARAVRAEAEREKAKEARAADLRRLAKWAGENSGGEDWAAQVRHWALSTLEGAEPEVVRSDPDRTSGASGVGNEPGTSGSAAFAGQEGKPEVQS